MRRSQRMAFGLLALGLAVGGCYGPFNLTRRLYRWNGQVGDKWEREIVFIIFAWVPVYGLTVLGDAVVFNSIEFWTGNNPVDAPIASAAQPHTKRIVRGDSEAVLTYQPISGQPTLLVQQYQQHQPAGTLRIEQRNGMTVASDEHGAVLLTAQTLPDGGVLIHDRNGRQVVARSPEEAQQFLSASDRSR